MIESSRGCPAVVGPLDLASMDSIQEFASAFNRAHPRLDILVNNAGCNFIPDWRTNTGVHGMVQVLSVSLQASLCCIQATTK